MFVLRSGWFLVAMLAVVVANADEPTKKLILPGEVFTVEDHTAFILLPAQDQRREPQPWVMYAPTLAEFPDSHEKWLHEQLVAAGIAVAGIDVGDSFGSPAGAALFDRLYEHLIEARKFSPKPGVLGRSRGGLMVSSWACKHPERVAGLAGIYPAFDFRSFPGIDQAAAAYGLSAGDLEAQQSQLNPISKFGKLANAHVPIFLIHGDRDAAVPIGPNSLAVQQAYKQAAAAELVELLVIEGGEHNFDERFFRCQKLVDFLIRVAGDTK